MVASMPDRSPRSLTLFLLASEVAEQSTLQVVFGLIAVPALVALNGYFVAAEFALVAIRRTRVQEMVNQGRVGAKALMHALENLNRSVAACQLGITVASLALG